MRQWRAALGSVAFFLAAPVVVAAVVPYLLTGWRTGDAGGGWLLPRAALGGLLVAAGLVVLIPAFVRFVREGAGTPSPVAPTERLVVGGWYRYVRNPMYVAVVATILGQAALLARPVLVWYALAVAAAMDVFVRVYEEPHLEARYGPAYVAYRQAVPGWIPRRPHRSQPPA